MNCTIVNEKKHMKMPRGIFLVYYGNKWIFVAWKDNKIVSLFSIFCGVRPIANIQICDISRNSPTEVDYPDVVRHYVRHMGKVYLLDSFIGRYKIKIKLGRWHFGLVQAFEIQWHFLINLGNVQKYYA